jgi:hypothetical protein
MLEPPTAPQEASPASVATAHAARSAFRKHGNVRDVVRESSCRGAGFPVVTFELAAPPPDASGRAATSSRFWTGQTPGHRQSGQLAVCDIPRPRERSVFRVERRSEEDR